MSLTCEVVHGVDTIILATTLSATAHLRHVVGGVGAEEMIEWVAAQYQTQTEGPPTTRCPVTAHIHAIQSPPSAMSHDQ